MFSGLGSIFIAIKVSDWRRKLQRIQKVEPFCLNSLGYSKPLVFLICRPYLFLNVPAINHFDVQHNWLSGGLP